MFTEYLLKLNKYIHTHLYTCNPNADSSNNLQMFQDEFLQFADATALNEKTNSGFRLHQYMWEYC